MRVEKTILGLKLIGSSGPRYSKEDSFRRAEAIYAKIKAQVDPGNDGKILAIDIESEEYEVDEKHSEAVDRLFARLDDPQIFCYRIGYEAADSLAGFPKRIAS
jgi:hypothetical protein